MTQVGITEVTLAQGRTFFTSSHFFSSVLNVEKEIVLKVEKENCCEEKDRDLFF